MANELREKALAEGVEMPGDTKKPAPETAVQDAKPADSSPAETVNQTGGSEITATETGRLPFHQDPEVQKYIEKQFAKREAPLKKQLDELNQRYTQQLELFNQQRAAQGKPEADKLPPEQEQAIMQLAEMLLNNPAIREKYGIGKAETEIASMRQEQALHAYESELHSEAKVLAEKFGGEPNEWAEKIEEYYLNDPWIADKNYQKGSISKVAKLYTAENAVELGERSANLKLINEQKNKKALNQATPSKGQQASAPSSNMTQKEFLQKRIQESGGLKF